MLSKIFADHAITYSETNRLFFNNPIKPHRFCMLLASLHNLPYIDGLHLTSRRPCWWYNTKEYVISTIVGSSRRERQTLSAASQENDCKPRIAQLKWCGFSTVRLHGGSPPTYTNKPCEWLVITMKDDKKTIEIGFLKNESQTMMVVVSKGPPQSLMIYVGTVFTLPEGKETFCTYYYSINALYPTCTERKL